MVSATEKRKIINAIIASSLFGLLLVIVFPIVDKQPWNIGFIPGSFAFGFVPVFLIMIYNIFVSSKYLVKMKYKCAAKNKQQQHNTKLCKCMKIFFIIIHDI